MRRALRVAALALLVVVGLLVTAGVAARFHDGPLGPFTGGTFRSGRVVSEPVVDWSFAAGASTLELELPSAAGRSITTWLVVDGGHLYVPCGVASAKRWPALVVADGAVRVRVNGEIHPVRATRVTDPATLARVGAAVGTKYGAGDGSGFVAGRDWLFELSSRS